MKNKIKKINKYYLGIGIFCFISIFIGIAFVAKADQVISPDSEIGRAHVCTPVT